MTDNPLWMDTLSKTDHLLEIETLLEQRIAELEDKLDEQANKFTDISRIGTVITSIMDLDRILPVVMESALAMVKAEVGQMVTLDEQGRVESSVSWGISQQVTDGIRNQDGVNLWDFIAQTGNLLRIDNISSDSEWNLSSEKAHIASLMAVPLMAQNRKIGALAVANKVDGGSFDDDDLFALEILARFASVAMENSALYELSMTKQKLEAEIDMARQLQSTLMPDKVMDFGKLGVHAYNTMAMQVGGDLYDVVQLSRNKFLLVVADVSNKGFPASLLMTSTRSLIRAYAIEKFSIAEIIMNVNEQLCSDFRGLSSMFVTLIMVCLDFEAGVIKSVNAGHPPGLVSYPDGKIVDLKSSGPFIGQFEGLNYTEQVLPMQPGTRIFLYTDGLFECVDARGRMLGISGLKNFFEKHHRSSPENFLRFMSDKQKEYNVDPDRIDDTTYIIADTR
jgi:sigma-B regulation protein RsbU (phosphoserine phosphatase)